MVNDLHPHQEEGETIMRDADKKRFYGGREEEGWISEGGRRGMVREDKMKMEKGYLED